MNPLISIIIPIYNAERTLRRCIDSILIQTYKNIEVILINDGSQDSSSQICHEYLLLDDRIVLYETQNKGVSSARNLGLDKMGGEWVTFVDSDDWVNDSYIQNL